MDNLLEYIIGITVVYADGREEGIKLKQKEHDPESARLAVLRELQGLEQELGVERLVSTVHGYVS